jgi:hypothetical protein
MNVWQSRLRKKDETPFINTTGIEGVSNRIKFILLCILFVDQIVEVIKAVSVLDLEIPWLKIMYSM